MPLTEREKEELARKIDQQRKAMWEGQTTRKLDEQTTRKPDEQTTRKSDEQTTRKSDEQTTRKSDEQKAKEQSQDERKELAKKIKQQRRAVWKGEPESRSKRPKSGRSIDRVLYDQKEAELAEQHAIDHSDQQETEEESKEYRSKAPPLKLALIVIIGLLGAIALGIAIGYIAVVRNLINV